ncbi:hypothetical protein CR105_01245 [Massilia eurypsychrophila]|uniref:DUF5625 domain-containing protein n=1 Tax=Massilia eurypsychrophila TaxID=1485217 RepID=A0A2G8TLA2_9BURK|nr:hypothetical protein [Massilia eurypsychrophila]PIL46806.1 hypothetical protein CR105_01245 [Massilia eurypsychrophila]
MTFFSWRCILAAACVLAAQPAAARAISAAETLLFQANHLQNVRAPLTLIYAFHKAGSLEQGFDDQVRLMLSLDKPAVTMHFLSGDRQRPVPIADNPEGNPVLLGFLERDIAEMARRTGGSGNYFRKRIRLALAESAQVRPQRFSYAGKAVDGNAISIAPYLNDPMHHRYGQYVGKRYTFVVSAQVPGGVYELRATVAGALGAAPLLEETLTLVSAESGKR